MHLNILAKPQKKLWDKLTGASFLEPFYLAGGTALALHLGHRESVDFDFFTPRALNHSRLLHECITVGDVKNVAEDDGSVRAAINGVNCSFFEYRFPLTHQAHLVGEIRIADLADIVPMKLIAISQRGAKKDFIDLHAMMQAGWGLGAMLSTLDERYKGMNYNKAHILKSLTYFDDADPQPMPRMLNETNWYHVKQALRTAVREGIATLS